MAPTKEKITDAEWSPTRPGVFYISTKNGAIDVWDIIDRTDNPSLTQSISDSDITYLTIKNISCKYQQKIYTSIVQSEHHTCLYLFSETTTVGRW